VTAVAGPGAWSMAARAAWSLPSEGTVSRSVRWPRALVAMSRPAGMVANQPIRTARQPAGPPTCSRRGRLGSHSAMPTMIRVMALKGPCRSSRARISPGSSAAGSADRGHQPPSSSMRAERSGCRHSRGLDDGVKLIAVRRSVVAGMVCPSRA
jgi:hypothetical protein